VSTTTPWADRGARRWVRTYTRGLPQEEANRRRDELASDLYEHRAASGQSHSQQLQVLGRVLWGIPADLSWRRAAKVPRERRLETGASMTLRKTTSAIFVLYAALMTLASFGTIGADGAGWKYSIPVVVAAGMIVLGVVLRDRAPRPSTVMIIVGAAAPAVVFYWIAVLFLPVWIGLSALAIASEPGRRRPTPVTT
jgi:hypothetical protein